MLRKLALLFKKETVWNASASNKLAKQLGLRGPVANSLKIVTNPATQEKNIISKNRYHQLFGNPATKEEIKANGRQLKDAKKHKSGW